MLSSMLSCWRLAVCLCWGCLVVCSMCCLVCCVFPGILVLVQSVLLILGAALSVGSSPPCIIGALGWLVCLLITSSPQTIWIFVWLCLLRILCRILRWCLLYSVVILVLLIVWWDHPYTLGYVCRLVCCLFLPQAMIEQLVGCRRMLAMWMGLRPLSDWHLAPLWMAGKVLIDFSWRHCLPELFCAGCECCRRSYECFPSLTTAMM